MNDSRKERPPVSEHLKRSSNSLALFLAVVGVLCVSVAEVRAVEAGQTNSAKLDESALLQSVLANDAARAKAVGGVSVSAGKTNVPVVVTNAPSTNAVSVPVKRPESKKHKILKFLLDGVPDEGVTNKVTKAAPKRQELKRRRPSVLSAFNFKQVTMTNLNLHPPFAKNDCEQCHGGSPQNPVLKLPQRELCLQCHQKNFAQPVAVQHKPVELGQCARCHDPHKSPNKKLLRKAGNALCVTCHKEKDAAALGPVVHAPLQGEGCLECHLPHGGPNKFLTKKPGKDLCYDCHDDFATKGKFVHAPVQSGDCMMCHNPHATQIKKLLLREVPETCFECHDDFQNQIKTAKFVHAPMQNGECLMCHDPHATDERFMLKKSGAAICMDCHEEKDMAAIKGHAGAQGKVCFDCHNPHFSEQPHLLKPLLKQLTSKQ